MAVNDSTRAATLRTLPTEIRQFMELAERAKALGYTLEHDTIRLAGEDQICIYVRTPAGKLAAIAPATDAGMAELRAWCAARETFDLEKLAHEIHDDVTVSVHIVERSDFTKLDGMHEIRELARDMRSALERYASRDGAAEPRTRSDGPPVERDRDRASMLAADAGAQLEGAVDVLGALCRDDELGRGHATFALLQRDLRAVRTLLERIESGDVAGAL